MTTNNNNLIKYVFMANAQNERLIGEYSSKSDSSWKKNAQIIFADYCKNIESKLNKNHKVPSLEGFFYCKFSKNKIFYLVHVSEKYPEQRAFSFIDDLIKDNIHLLVDSKGELNQPGQNALKALVIEYDKNKTNESKDEDKLSSLNGDINEIKIEMKNNVKKVLANTDDLQSIDVKAVRIKDNAELFKKDAANLKMKTYWQNLKWKIVFILLIIVLIVVFVVPLFIGGGADKTSKDKESISDGGIQPSTARPAVNNTDHLFLN